MIVYRGKKVLSKNADYDRFVQLFGEHIVSKKTDEPFLLIRPDGARLELVLNETKMMLCLAFNSRRLYTSYGSSYVDAAIEFQGLAGPCEAREENFIDAQFAVKEIALFFSGSNFRGAVDFRIGIPDKAITEFPEPIPDEQSLIKERLYTEGKKVPVTEELKNDMKLVCEFLDEFADDPDTNIDFDDAIQIGSLCGGRVNPKTDTYQFTFYLPSGGYWSFEYKRYMLDDIADGISKTITVDECVSKR